MLKHLPPVLMVQANLAVYASATELYAQLGHVSGCADMQPACSDLPDASWWAPICKAKALHCAASMNFLFQLRTFQVHIGKNLVLPACQGIRPSLPCTLAAAAVLSDEQQASESAACSVSERTAAGGECRAGLV